MNTKAAFAVVGEWVSGLTSMLSGFVALGVLCESRRDESWDLPRHRHRR
jgi:hypothetical protein